MTDAQRLRSRIESGECLVGVIGLGYVGLPLSLTFAERGLRVLGFDIDRDKVAALEAGESYIRQIESERVSTARRRGVFGATADLTRLDEPDCLLICVPTPLTPGLDPDLSFVEETATHISTALRSGQLVVLESTTYPGTTRGILLAALERSGLECGAEFFLAFSPERENPGSLEYSTSSIPKVVGGVDEISGDLAETLYRRIVPETVRVSSAEVAEATKLTENIFRAVNIALVNELKILFDRMGIDVREVLDAAATKPFGFMRFEPGPGWGGHCIPVDPYYLAWKARQHGLTARFVELAGTINVEMPKYVVAKLEQALSSRGKTLPGSRVLILGLAYKKDVADPRESPAFEILHRLQGRGAELSYHDPLIPEAPRMRTWPDLPLLRSTALDEASIRAQDAIILVTDHSGIDYGALVEAAELIVDTRGVYRDGQSNVVLA